MNSIIDASVATKWFLNEERSNAARMLLDDAVLRIAPDWIIQEVSHAIFRQWRNNNILAEQARMAVGALPNCLNKLLQSADYAALAFDIALTIRHPVYDCLYIACAEIEHATLITDDKKLFRAVQNTDYRNYVRLLDDPDLLTP